MCQQLIRIQNEVTARVRDSYRPVFERLATDGRVSASKTRMNLRVREIGYNNLAYKMQFYNIPPG